MKHWDFILIDLLCLQVSFLLGYWIVRGLGNPYQNDAYQYQETVLFLSQLVVIAFTSSYSGILRRKRFDEAVVILKFTAEIYILALVFLFVVHTSDVASRLQFGFTAIFFLILDFFGRWFLKVRILKSGAANGKTKSIVLFTSSNLVETVMKRLNEENTFRDFRISAIVLMDLQPTQVRFDYEIPVVPISDDVMKKVSHGWVDEAFLFQSDDLPFPTQLMDELMSMGITINVAIEAMSSDRWPGADLRKLGSYKVISNSIRRATAKQTAYKRAIDVMGGIAGCVLTGIIFIFIAPAIYIKSPGPIFFTQNRVGQNGKIFKIYKFRSMYMDAEQRKAELMASNKIKDGMMFKLDDDPRIIGSEKKDRNGRPKGIGNFIRNTSLDEFPQFFNVLKGDMSLVGWRPCTIEEWQKYDLQHRIRASMKPGITGMWQVSGRSNITDFEEVVRLDREYIEEWSLLLDLKILLKTVLVVITKQGAE